MNDDELFTDDDIQIAPLDISEYLHSEEDINGYLNAVLEYKDTNLLLAALKDVAKARGMSKSAQDAGMTREGLYKALRPNAHPQWDTIWNILSAFGYTLSLKKTTPVS